MSVALGVLSALIAVCGILLILRGRPEIGAAVTTVAPVFAWIAQRVYRSSHSSRIVGRKST